MSNVARLHRIAEARPTEAAKSPGGRPAQVRHLLPSGCWSVQSLSQLYTLESAWDELAADAAYCSPFHSWAFAIEWVEHFVRHPAQNVTGRFEVAVAVDERRRIIGIAPMFEEQTWGPHFGRALQPFGRGLCFETMTDEPIVLLRRGAEDRAFAMLAEHFARRAPQQGWDVVALPWYGARDDGTAQMAMSRRWDHVQLTRQLAGPLVLTLPDSFEAFRAGLNKSMRDNVAYYPRRISREQGDWRVEFASRPDEIAQATAQLVDLHRERGRWSEGPCHGNHIPGSREASFLTGWFQRLSERGDVGLGRLFMRGELVAAQAFVQQGDTVSVYYSGHVEAARRYSPLTVLATEMIRNAIERGIRRVVFPPGNDLWKTRWGAETVVPVRETSIYVISVGSILRGVARRARMARRPAA